MFGRLADLGLAVGRLAGGHSQTEVAGSDSGGLPDPIEKPIEKKLV